MKEMNDGTIAFLQCYIAEFKRPDWLSWFGFYEQKDRVKKAEAHLERLTNQKLFDATTNAAQLGTSSYNTKG